MPQQTNSSDATDGDRLITERDLAELFGIAVITATQNRHRAKDWPPHLKIGRAIRYSTRAVREWMASHTIGKVTP
jgi:predicted DNA-binding transcriptional regulator AlpA